MIETRVSIVHLLARNQELTSEEKTSIAATLGSIVGAMLVVVVVMTIIERRKKKQQTRDAAQKSIEDVELGAQVHGGWGRH